MPYSYFGTSTIWYWNYIDPQEIKTTVNVRSCAIGPCLYLVAKFQNCDILHLTIKKWHISAILINRMFTNCYRWEPCLKGCPIHCSLPALWTPFTSELMDWRLMPSRISKDLQIGKSWYPLQWNWKVWKIFLFQSFTCHRANQLGPFPGWQCRRSNPVGS